MKLLNVCVFVAILAAALPAMANETNLVETLRPSAKRAVSRFQDISPGRKQVLEEVAAFIGQRKALGKPAELTFICTHNSRRSHLAQIWAQTAAVYYGLNEVKTYSGGTEVTACNIRTVRALRRAGFPVVQSTTSTNPLYLAQISDVLPPVRMQSKVYNMDPNPQRDFAALFACDQADDACPTVVGAALRRPLHYTDPKVSDNSPAENATYDERSQQIATEMFYMMSRVKGVTQTSQRN